jgi:hypothetical protein
MGSVVYPGPVVKLVITTSSKEMVKARNSPTEWREKHGNVCHATLAKAWSLQIHCGLFQ